MKGMSLAELVTSLRDMMSVARVFGQPYEQGGVTVIPAAVVRGGVGSGGGRQTSGEEGEGGGLGLIARPAGVYVVRDGRVRWQPAVDVNRIVTLGVLGWVAVTWVVARRRSG
jgi:uncharacterized spore protein YtfJ